jgi:hypothetical protein
VRTVVFVANLLSTPVSSSGGKKDPTKKQHSQKGDCCMAQIFHCFLTPRGVQQFASLIANGAVRRIAQLEVKS